MAFVEDLRRKAREQGAPVTIGLIVALVAMSLFFYFLHMRFFDNLVLSPNWISQPWTLLTYPFAYPGLLGIGLIWLLITAWWLFWVGVSVERDVGSPKFAAFWFLTTLLAGLLMVLAGLVFRAGVGLEGPFVPIAAVTVAWAARNPQGLIQFWGVIPLSGKVLMWITIALVFFAFGYPNPVIGLLMTVPMATAYMFATNKLPGLSYSKPIYKAAPSKAQIEKQNRFDADIRRRKQERAEKERLRKLFEGSIKDDDK